MTRRLTVFRNTGCQTGYETYGLSTIKRLKVVNVKQRGQK